MVENIKNFTEIAETVNIPVVWEQYYSLFFQFIGKSDYLGL